MEIAQVIAGYQLQTTVAAGVSAQNYITSAVGGPAAIAGSAGVGATYIDRPTVIYAPLTGNDFIKKLMTPMPPSAVLFLLQSGYPATLVMPIAVNSINGVANESRRAGHEPARRSGVHPPRPTALRVCSCANALQIRIERSKDNSEVSVIGFPPVNETPEVAAKIAEVRRILHVSAGPAGATGPLRRLVRERATRSR